MSAQNYADPSVLVSAEWVQQHLNDPSVRVVESSGDALLYPMSHIPGAVKIDWHNERITLSMKSLAADPWEKAVEKYPAGSKHAGRVARVTDFGAFVSLEPGLDGLVHISEFRTEGKYGREGQLSGKSDIPVKVGQTLSVQVLTVDRANRRISLKQATSREEDETSAKYLGNAGDSDTYNPFANLLKKK